MGFNLVNNSGRRVNILNDDAPKQQQQEKDTTARQQPTPPLVPQLPSLRENLTINRPSHHAYHHPVPPPPPPPPSHHAQYYYAQYYPSPPPQAMYPHHHQMPLSYPPPPPPPPPASFYSPYGTTQSVIMSEATHHQQQQQAAAPPHQHLTEAHSPTNGTQPKLNPTRQLKNKKYTCHCGRSFTTSGHLARHNRIHSGEKNYHCPWEGCESRFSRQDNCMQHYRTHQGGKSRSNRNRVKKASSADPKDKDLSASPVAEEAKSEPATGTTTKDQEGNTLPPINPDYNPLNAFAGVAIMQTVQ